MGMKTFVAAALFVCALSTYGQVGTSPRTLVRRIEPQLPPQRPAAARPVAPGAASAAAVNKAPFTAAEREEKAALMSEEEKKKLQWQMDRAEKGSDNAQFELGVRYLDGKGVEKDPKKARKWLEASAKQGNADAKKKLAEHPELPPLDEPKKESAPAPAKKS
jgi:TPR repeat protein